jgi:hypothetical protein
MSKEQPLNITLNNDPQQLVFTGRNTDPFYLSLTNNDTRDAVSVRVNVVRGDLLKKTDLTLTDEELLGGGFKIIDEGWAQARILETDTWTTLDEWDSHLELGALPAGDTKGFWFQLDVPTDNTDNTRMCFAIMISASVEQEPQVTSLVIDQSVFNVLVGGTMTGTTTLSGALGFSTDVTWYSSNTDIFNVESTEGDPTTCTITGVALGRAVLKAVSAYNPRFSSSRYVYVVELTAYFYDDFESYYIGEQPSTFTLIYNGTGGANQRIVDVTGHDSEPTQAFQLQGAGSWAATFRHDVLQYNPTTETIILDGWVQPVNGTWPADFGLGNPGGTWGSRTANVVFYGGRIQAVRDGNFSTRTDMQAYSLGQWYRITIVANPTTRLFDVYIDKNLTPAATAIPMHPTLSPQYIQLVAGNVGTNTVYFDEVGFYPHSGGDIAITLQTIWQN